MHATSRYWTNPRKFDPTRFLKSGQVHKPDTFVPFGMGELLFTNNLRQNFCHEFLIDWSSAELNLPPFCTPIVWLSAREAFKQPSELYFQDPEVVLEKYLLRWSCSCSLPAYSRHFPSSYPKISQPRQWSPFLASTCHPHRIIYAWNIDNCVTSWETHFSLHDTS